MSELRDFQGKKAIVTGGGSGIGEACVKLLSGRGAEVAVVDLNGGNARKVAAANGGRAVELDVTDAARVAAAVAALAEEGFVPDVLINCAGLREFADPLEISAEHWQKLLDVNLSGTFYITQTVARLWRDLERPGAIVNTSSTSGIYASEQRVTYVSAKHAIVGLTRQLAVDLGKLGIRVNAVAPGVIRTPMTEAYFSDPDMLERLDRAYPLGRVGMPEDVAEVMVFLASDGARHVTGTVVPVDGGYTAGRRK